MFVILGERSISRGLLVAEVLAFLFEKRLSLDDFLDLHFSVDHEEQMVDMSIVSFADVALELSKFLSPLPFSGGFQFVLDPLEERLQQLNGSADEEDHFEGGIQVERQWGSTERI